MDKPFFSAWSSLLSSVHFRVRSLFFEYFELFNCSYLLFDAKNIHISMAKNVNIITYETSTRKISFIAGLDKTANKTGNGNKRDRTEKNTLFFVY